MIMVQHMADVVIITRAAFPSLYLQCYNTKRESTDMYLSFLKMISNSFQFEFALSCIQGHNCKEYLVT